MKAALRLETVTAGHMLKEDIESEHLVTPKGQLEVSEEDLLSEVLP